jgi:hypothetical protein
VAEFPGWVYFIHAPDLDVVKIGYSARPEKRIRELANDASTTLVLLGAIPGTLADEGLLHACFDDLHAADEWYWDDPLILKFAAGLDQSFGRLTAKGSRRSRPHVRGVTPHDWLLLDDPRFWQMRRDERYVLLSKAPRDRHAADDGSPSRGAQPRRMRAPLNEARGTTH